MPRITGRHLYCHSMYENIANFSSKPSFALVANFYYFFKPALRNLFDFFISLNYLQNNLFWELWAEADPQPHACLCLTVSFRIQASTQESSKSSFLSGIEPFGASVACKDESKRSTKCSWKTVGEALLFLGSTQPFCPMSCLLVLSCLMCWRKSSDWWVVEEWVVNFNFIEWELSSFVLQSHQDGMNTKSSMDALSRLVPRVGRRTWELIQIGCQNTTESEAGNGIWPTKTRRSKDPKPGAGESWSSEKVGVKGGRMAVNLW